ANRGGPADDATGLVLRANHGHLFKGAGVAKTCEEERQEHCAEEPPELVWVGGVHKYSGHSGKDGHTDTTDKRPDGTTELVTQRARCGANTSTNEWAQEGISCTTRQIFNANSFSKRGTGTIDLVDDECELRGKACKSAEGHQIDHGHHPGVDVAKD